MKKSENKTKIKLLKLWEILCQETDPDHPMSTPEILKRLMEFGIECDRRTLYDDIKTLNEYGYNVECTRNQSNNYSVDVSAFDTTELHILIDAVQASSFITEKKTRELVDKIAHLGGSARAQILKGNTVEFNSVKSTNERIYYTINEISEAISSHKKIEFTYFDHNCKREKVYRKSSDGNVKVYKANPYATVFFEDKYYLICYHDNHDNMTHYRVDRMEGVKVLNENVREVNFALDFDVAKYKKQIFGMYTGETKRVKIEADASLIDVIFDKFGDINMQKIDDSTLKIEVDVQVSPTFITWCCSFGNKMKVVSPPTVVEKIKERVNEIKDIYEQRS